ncbi:unnamed protein product [Protopolystoma xenopodis]|uniref:Uncharacterized protein n=1 Tax=Protopolystoma xenopodis TaxID=117903 RepID=A0A3S5CSN6_9PLAT|nr:unnamed protein product [Protopolystoma xenopodis]
MLCKIRFLVPVDRSEPLLMHHQFKKSVALAAILGIKSMVLSFRYQW